MNITYIKVIWHCLINFSFVRPHRMSSSCKPGNLNTYFCAECGYLDSLCPYTSKQLKEFKKQNKRLQSKGTHYV